MGLDCSHNAWSGSYGKFMKWRKHLAEVAGLPPLELMEGFYEPLKSETFSIPTLYHGSNTNLPASGISDEPYLASIDRRLPIRWESLKPNALYMLLYHSDCDGIIEPEDCIKIADSLIALLPSISNKPYHEESKETFKKWTKKFINGLISAALADEPLRFK